MDDLQSLLDQETETKELSEEKLGRLAIFTNDYNSVKVDIEELEEKLSEKKQQLNILETAKLPDLLDELGIEGMDLPNNQKLEVKKIYGGKIDKAQGMRAVNWLLDNGYSDLVKTQVFANFAKGKLKEATEFASKLKDEGYEASANQTVHGQTLKSWIKEMDENNKMDEIPEELFNPSVFRRASIK